MIYTVTFNPAVDYIVYVEDIKIGRTNRAESEDVVLGGKGINVSVMLTNLGVPNRALGFVAGTAGALLERGLSEQGIATDFIHLSKGQGMTRLNVKIRGKEESEINGVGPYIGWESIEALIDKLKQARDEDVIVLAGSVPPSVSENVYGYIMKRLKDKALKVVVDASGHLLKNTLKYAPFLIKPNREELEELYQIKIRELAEVLECAKDLKRQGAKNVLVSLGSEGSVLLDETGRVIPMGTPRGTLKSSVGSGDSMIAGFLAGYQRTGDFEAALRMGAACGSATAFSPALALRSQVERLYRVLLEEERNQGNII